MARILVVDDDASARELMRLYLEAQGHSVALAGDGAHALQLIELRTAHEDRAWDERSAPVDVIVSDVEMPVMDGLELLEALRAHPDASGLPVIFLTARGGDAALLDAAAACAVPVLSKPVDIQALARQIELALLGPRDRGMHVGEPPSLNAG